MKTLNNFTGALISTILAILLLGNILGFGLLKAQNQDPSKTIEAKYLRYMEATEKLLDTIWEDQEAYCYDVLSSTDEYQEYLEAKENL